MIKDEEAIKKLDDVKKSRKNESKFYEAVNQVEELIDNRNYRIRRLESGRLEKIIITIVCWVISSSSFFLGVIYKIPFTEIEATINGTDKSGSVKGVASIYMFGLLFAAMPLIWIFIRWITQKRLVKYVEKTT